MFGLFLGFLVLLALLPFTVWFAVKCIRAGYVQSVREDFKRRPFLHVIWAVGSLVCLNAVVTWLVPFGHR